MLPTIPFSSGLPSRPPMRTREDGFSLAPFSLPPTALLQVVLSASCEFSSSIGPSSLRSSAELRQQGRASSVKMACAAASASA